MRIEPYIFDFGFVRLQSNAKKYINIEKFLDQLTDDKRYQQEQRFLHITQRTFVFWRMCPEKQVELLPPSESPAEKFA